MKLGIFDSGIGGEAIAAALRRHFPSAEITTVNDREHLPYGDKPREELQLLTDVAIQPLLGSDVVVIACNSATTAAIDYLRKKYPDQKFIGIEPMVKPAALATETGIIAVCATPATLASKRYQELKAKFGLNKTFIEPNCRDWAKMIEDNTINEAVIAEQILGALDQGADIIVLGCTHYHWIKEEIEALTAGKAKVIEPSSAIARRVEKLLNIDTSPITSN